MGIRVLEEHVSSLARGRTYNGGLVLFHCRGMSFFAPIFQLSLLSSWWGYWDILDETGNVLVSAGRRTAHAGGLIEPQKETQLKYVSLFSG